MSLADNEWVTRQVEAMAAAWERGEHPAAEQFLDAAPDLDPEAAIRLVYEEVCLRRESGEDVPTAEVIARFPAWRRELEVLLHCDRLMRPQAVPTLPETGEVLGGFRLIAELGRGTAGRTFLAAQPSLADRPVVLKVIPHEHGEHLSLARLQHTHIVPLYSEHVFADRGLRALCMPFLGGTTLDRILGVLDDIPPGRRMGHDLLAALERTTAGPMARAAANGPLPRRIAQASYVEATCRIGVALAEALQYAHDRGLVHMDVKPSNVLIAADGQPMLLDFHLARGPVLPGCYPPARLGGTRGWTSPELRAAMAALNEGRAIEHQVDRATDIYSLGLLLYDALGGPPGTNEMPQRPRLERCNVNVSVGLADIVHKCLAADPAQRYTSAAELAADLRRHLDNQPLRGVANRSLSERWRKWTRRSPHSLARGAVWLTALAAVIVVTAIGVSWYRQRLRDLDTNLDDAERFLAAHQYPDAERSARRGVYLAAPTPAARSQGRAFESRWRRSVRGLKADELHVLADHIRFRVGGTPRPTDELRHLVERARSLWQESGPFAQTASEYMLDAPTEQQIADDLIEVAIVWSDLRVRFAPSGQAAAAREEALRVLAEVDSRYGPSAAIHREQRVCADALGYAVPDRLPSISPMRSGDCYHLGCSLLRGGDFAAAIDAFRRAREADPRAFWPNFYEGVCAHRLGRFDDALAAFRACVTLAPTTAECYYNRALAFEALARPADAKRDYTRALELNPRLPEAYLNRGLLSHKAGDLRAAIADYERALALAPGGDTEARIRENLALARRPGSDERSASRRNEAASR